MIYTLPFIAALVGWFTNYIAVKMLFHPKQPMNILGVYTLQGIFPKNQQQVAEKIGKMVAEELLSSNDLKEKLNNPENILSIKELVEAKIDYYLNVTFPKNYPITAALVGDKRRTKFKDTVMEEVDESVPAMIDSYMANIEERFNVEHIIKENRATSKRKEGFVSFPEATYAHTTPPHTHHFTRLHLDCTNG